ncbi:prepilin-type N-terminal cleavage/methylation domain-containing protein [bacterium]|nr:prepilin-type N-terminal cleavage/methylation domain-containing protein [bacterium]
MRLKKGFTLAEILIVLMTIGVIAALTIPSVMKGVVEGQLKTGYKKAFNAISNIALAEKVAGFLPTTNISSETMRLFEMLNADLSVTGYVSNTDSPVNSGTVVRGDGFKNTIKINGRTYGPGEATINVTPTSITTYNPSPWIVTDDNIAYSIMCAGTTGVAARCLTKDQISNLTTQSEAIQNSCTIVIVDVNGLQKGPNKFDPQAGPESGFRINTHNSVLPANSALDTLTGDQYLIFLGSDGASAGPRQNTITGRIMADLK